MASDKNNIVRVPPRRKRYYHKGMHGWVEYHPSTKTWTYTLKLQITTVHKETLDTEAEAVLQLKRAIEIAIGGGVSIRSID